MTQAVILAGGKGTRLAERLNGRPKPLIEVGGVPLLQRQLDCLTQQGVDDFVLLVNHAAEQIEAFVAGLANERRRIRVIDDGHPRGTAGAVLACLEQLSAQFIVIYGDTLFNVDVGRLLEAHRAADACGTLFLHPNDHPYDSDLVDLDEHGFIRAFHPSPHPVDAMRANLVNAALYVLERDSLVAWKATEGELDFGRHLFPQMLRAGLRLRGYRSFEYIKDVGTPDRLDRAEKHLRTGVVARAFHGAKQQCVFVDRDGTLNELRDYVRSPGELSLIPGVASAIKTLNQSEYRVAVITNQPVIARGDITSQQLDQIHAKLETALGASGAFVDGIYYCPHHPRRGFAGERVELKIDCDCRKPRDGLLRRAAVDLNVDLRRSWVVGDSTADMAMARSAGVRSVLVATGEGGADGKYAAPPDFIARDFASAVKFICEIHPRMAAALDEILPDVDPAQSVLLCGGPSAQIVAKVLAHQLEAGGETSAELHVSDEGTLVRRVGWDRARPPGDRRGDMMSALSAGDEVPRSHGGPRRSAIRVRVEQSAASQLAWSQLGYCEATGRPVQGGAEVVFDLDRILAVAEIAS